MEDAAGAHQAPAPSRRPRAGRPWTDDDHDELASLLREGHDAATIAQRLHRSTSSIRNRAARMRPLDTPAEDLTRRPVQAMWLLFNDPDYDWETPLKQRSAPAGRLPATQEVSPALHQLWAGELTLGEAAAQLERTERQVLRLLVRAGLATDEMAAGQHVGAPDPFQQADQVLGRPNADRYRQQIDGAVLSAAADPTLTASTTQQVLDRYLTAAGLTVHRRANGGHGLALVVAGQRFPATAFGREYTGPALHRRLSALRSRR